MNQKQESQSIQSTDPFYQSHSPSSDNQPNPDALSLFIACLQVGPLLLRLVELVEAELVNEAERHASVLKHMVEGEVLDEVVAGVDMAVGVLKGRLDDEGRGVAGLGSRGVVGAGITALGLYPGDAAVLCIRLTIVKSMTAGG